MENNSKNDNQNLVIPIFAFEKMQPKLYQATIDKLKE